MCVSTANRYSLLSEDASDHQGFCDDRPGGATSAPRTGVSQLENYATEDKTNENKNDKENLQDEIYEIIPKSSPRPTIGRGRGSVASGHCTSDKGPIKPNYHTAGPVGLAKCCRFFCCGPEKMGSSSGTTAGLWEKYWVGHLEDRG